MADASLALTWNSDLGAYFREPLDVALKEEAVKASTGTEAYLVMLLRDYARPEVTTGAARNESVTLALHEALSSSGHERFKRLQGLGDAVLYSMGYFHGTQFAGVDEAYVQRVGASAYTHAARMLRTGQGTASGPDILEELAVKFDRFVAVLRCVSDWVLAKGAQDERSLLKVYDRYVRTGSPILRAELCRRGLLPLEGPSESQ